MKGLYHARFKGQRNDQFGALYNFEVIVAADSIHDVKGMLEERYTFIQSYCVSDLQFFETEIIETKCETAEILAA
jgi:hypothetical protein